MTTWDATTGATTPIHVQLDGDLRGDLAQYLEQRTRDVLTLLDRPVLHARARLTHHADPRLARPYVAEANLDVDGRFVRAQVLAPSAREAVDMLHDRLRQRLEHDLQYTQGDWEERRGRRATGEPHEWRHGDEPAHRPPWFPRPPEEREIVRHKSVSPATCTLDEAAEDMDLADYDFHLFTEEGTGQDSVLYRAGPSGYRLAQVDPHPEALAGHDLTVTVSDQRAPLLTTAEAVERMAQLDRPFLFFLDAERAQGALLYHRYDGHYGLITPAESSRGGEV
jgi:hypothetical protein